MKVYKIQWQENGQNRVSWRPSQAEAKKANAELSSGMSTVEAVEIPTDKVGLLEWLNQHVKTIGEPTK